MDKLTSQTNEILSFVERQFKSKKMELDYRKFFFDSDKKIILRIIFLAILAISFLILSEYWIAPGRVDIQKANFIRISFIVLLCMLSYAVSLVKEEKKIDFLVLIFAMSCFGVQVAVGLTRPASHSMTNVINIFIVFVYYFTIPNRLLFQVLPSAILSVCCFICFKPAHLIEQNSLLLVYVMANTIGIIYSRRLHEKRRMLFYHLKGEMEATFELQQAEQKYRYVVDNIDVGLVVIQEGKMVFANRITTDTLNCSPEEMINNPDPFFYILPEDKPKIFENQAALLAGEEKKAVYIIRTVSPDESERYLECTSIQVVWEQKKATLNILKNITQKKNLEDELNFINERLNKQNKSLSMAAKMDLLTGIYNRRALYENIEDQWSRAVRNEEECSILLIDIDHFKKVNDTYGHQVGDEVLIKVAKKLNSLRRSYDRLGRWGGEEFLLFLPDTSVENAVAIAERLRRNVSEMTFHIDDNVSIGVTISLGISSKSLSDTMELEVFFNHADNALYEAKEKGRNRACVFRGINEQTK